MTDPKQLLMIVPVAVPETALPGIAAQIPQELIRSDSAIDSIGTRNGASLFDSVQDLFP